MSEHELRRTIALEEINVSLKVIAEILYKHFFTSVQPKVAEDATSSNSDEASEPNKSHDTKETA